MSRHYDPCRPHNVAAQCLLLIRCFSVKASSFIAILSVGRTFWKRRSILHCICSLPCEKVWCWHDMCSRHAHQYQCGVWFLGSYCIIPVVTLSAVILSCTRLPLLVFFKTSPSFFLFCGFQIFVCLPSWWVCCLSCSVVLIIILLLRSYVHSPLMQFIPWTTWTRW